MYLNIIIIFKTQKENKMKKLDTLKKTIATTKDNEQKQRELLTLAKAIAQNEAIDDMKSLSNNDLLALLQFAELEKALKVKDKYELVLDINYSDYRSTQIKVTQMSLLNNKQKRALHLYQHKDTFDICFSCSESVRAKVEAIAELKKAIATQYRAEVAKTTVFKKVHFDELVNACKFALLILESTLDEITEFVAEQTKAE